MAAQKKELDLARIENLYANFCTQEEVAADQNCSVDTLDRRCAELFIKGREMGKLSLRAQQYRTAMGTPGVGAEYLRENQTPDGKQYGALVFDADGRPIKIKSEVKAQPPNVIMQIWLGKQYLDQSEKFKLPDDPHQGFAFSYEDEPKAKAKAKKGKKK